MLYTTKIGRLFSACKSPNFFVTTPIFYVNAAPHIGHLYSAVVADAIHRYVKLKNNRVDTIFSTGTDEHGTKIQQAASLNKVPVDEYCTNISSLYRDTFRAANIEYSDFIRTTEQRHRDAVTHFWNTLKSKGHIYSSQYSGWYCVSDEMFLTESQLKLNLDGTKVSADSGHPVEWTEEVNYMFTLGAFQNDVLNWLKSGGRIRPLQFEKILLNYLEEPLPDISVSRPSSRVHWGIRVPGDNTQSIYVWLDALVNYLTCVGYPGREDGGDRWPPTLQVIGKDILKFHGIYWPAFLIAAGLEPPQKLLVHSHWTVDGQKMSKSKFNVVEPTQRAEVYTMEGLRYFLLREGVAHSDGNYSDVKVLHILNAELADTFGNLLSRSCAKTLNPRQVFPKISDHHFQELYEMDAVKRLIASVSQLPDKCAAHYESYNFYLVVDQVMATLHAANNFFETCKPWELRTRSQRKIPANSSHVGGGNNILSSGDEDILKLETIISVTLDTLRKCAIILQPIIPSMSRKLLDKLAVPLDERTWENLKSSAWESGPTSTERYLGSTDAVLFRRIWKEGEKARVKKNS